MIEWIGTHQVGASSKTMWCALMIPNANEMGQDVRKGNYAYDVPYDVDDFSRCYDLYNFCELTQDDLRTIEQEFPFWKPLIDEWSNLVSAFEEGNFHRVKEIIDSKHDEILELRGYVKVIEGFWVRREGDR